MMPDTPDTLRRWAVRSTTVAAIGCPALVLVAGRRNSSVVLIALFVGWVAFPFVAGLLADRRLRDRPVVARRRLHLTMIVLAAGALASYAYVTFGPRRQKMAAPFLLIPAASLAVIAGVALTTRSARAVVAPSR
jgi:peptidoglycan/LPS O-acetylase OafA/YrhL